MSRCPICNKNYTHKDVYFLYDHIEKEHPDILKGMSPAQYLFNKRNNKTHGTCVQCKKETLWLEESSRYSRYCSEKCLNAYREEFKNRMMKKYGKTHLLNDANVQINMLKNRSISGTYKFSNGISRDYTGTYEKDFLMFMDKTLMWNPLDIETPASVSIEYDHDGKKKLYIPDARIVSLDIIVEVKGTNNHYQARDSSMEKAKDDKASKMYGSKYVKIVDKNYNNLLNVLRYELSNNFYIKSSPIKRPI